VDRQLLRPDLPAAGPEAFKGAVDTWPLVQRGPGLTGADLDYLKRFNPVRRWRMDSGAIPRINGPFITTAMNGMNIPPAFEGHSEKHELCCEHLGDRRRRR